MLAIPENLGGKLLYKEFTTHDIINSNSTTIRVSKTLDVTDPSLGMPLTFTIQRAKKTAGLTCPTSYISSNNVQLMSGNLTVSFYAIAPAINTNYHVQFFFYCYYGDSPLLQPGFSSMISAIDISTFEDY